MMQLEHSKFIRSREARYMSSMIHCLCCHNIGSLKDLVSNLYSTLETLCYCRKRGYLSSLRSAGALTLDRH